MNRFHRLLAALLLGLGLRAGRSPAPWPGFPRIYGPLFADAQRALPDPKAMVDAIPGPRPRRSRRVCRARRAGV